MHVSLCDTFTSNTYRDRWEPLQNAIKRVHGLNLRLQTFGYTSFCEAQHSHNFSSLDLQAHVLLPHWIRLHQRTRCVVTWQSDLMLSGDGLVRQVNPASSSGPSGHELNPSSNSCMQAFLRRRGLALISFTKMRAETLATSQSLRTSCDNTQLCGLDTRHRDIDATCLN
jgi:hypothetical protein